MAFRSSSYWRSIANRFKGSTTYTTATAPKLKADAPTGNWPGQAQDHQQTKPRAVKGEFVPVYVAVGLIGLGVALGLYTVNHQLAHSPGVRVKKKSRESVPEVEDPDKVVEEANRFVKNSVFRQVAHIQEYDNSEHAVPDPIRGDAFAHKPKALTLKDVGVDPQKQ